MNTQKIITELQKEKAFDRELYRRHNDGSEREATIAHFIGLTWDRAIEAAERVGAGWISVRDRLPEEDGAYICTYSVQVCGEHKTLCRELLHEDGEWYFDEDCLYNIDLAAGCVIAWMPLPESYQPEGASGQVDRRDVLQALHELGGASTNADPEWVRGYDMAIDKAIDAVMGLEDAG